jgi:uncharacterized protein YndB with AHSA1/START domain
MPDIHHLLRIQAPREKVFAALTTAEGIRNWWTREAELDAHVGGIGEFRFYGGKSVTKVRIDALEPGERVAWTTLSTDAPGGWSGTTIAFALKADGDDTVLALAHCGFREANEGFALVSTGWAYYLVSLQQYLETGRGTPQQEKDFSIVTRPRGRGPEIRHEIPIKTSPQELYRALTDPRRLGQWWIPDTRGESKPGNVLEFWFGGDACQAMRVKALETDSRVCWQAVESDLSDWAGTEVEFVIQPQDAARSRLQFRHSGWQGEAERFPYYSTSWAIFLVSLKDLLETGQGHPFPNAWIS